MRNVFLWFAKNPGYLGLIVIAIGIFFYLQNRDQNVAQAATTACEAAHMSSTIKGVQTHERKKTEIRRLDDEQLVRRYCRWVYDMPYEQCIRNVKPVR